MKHQLEKEREGEQLQMEKIRELADKEEAIQFSKDKTAGKTKSAKVNVVKATNNEKQNDKKQFHKKPKGKNAEGKDWCARCDKYMDHETEDCKLNCTVCFKPLRIHRGNTGCWYKKKSVKVVEAEKVDTVETGNNTISAEPVVVGGFEFVEAEPMHEVRTVTVDADSVTVEESTIEIATENNEINASEIQEETDEEVVHIKLTTDKTPLMYVWGTKNAREEKPQTVSILQILAVA